MTIKVLEILLVANPYDAYILEEDGSLASRIINEYSGLNLSQPPRVTRTASAEEALGLLARKTFDLVLTMTSLADMDVNAFGRKVKELRPGRPVVVLALDRKELHQLWRAIDRQAIDAAFGDGMLTFVPRQPRWRLAAAVACIGLILLGAIIVRTIRNRRRKAG